MMHFLLINNSEKLFIPKLGWKIRKQNSIEKENKIAYKKPRNLCVSLRKKRMKNCIKKLTDKGLTTSKTFWKFLKPFLTNKGFVGNNDIALIHKNKIISDEKQMTKMFNSYYINIAEKSSGTKPITFSTNFKTVCLRYCQRIIRN